MPRITTKIKKPIKQPIKEIVRFGVHIGDMVRKEYEKIPNLTQLDLAKKLNLSPTGLSARLKRPNYGDIYDLIETCLVLKVDMISPLVGILKNQGIKPAVVFSADEYQDLKIKYDDQCKTNGNLIRDNDLLHEYIEKLKAELRK